VLLDLLWIDCVASVAVSASFFVSTVWCAPHLLGLIIFESILPCFSVGSNVFTVLVCFRVTGC
jgi:hypothetical protein